MRIRVVPHIPREKETMLAIIAGLGCFAAAIVIALAAQFMHEASAEQKRQQAEEKLSRQAAKMQNEREALDAKLVDELCGTVAVSRAMDDWRQGVAKILTVSGRPQADWDLTAIESWKDEQLEIATSAIQADSVKVRSIIWASAILGGSLVAIAAWIAVSTTYTPSI